MGEVSVSTPALKSPGGFFGFRISGLSAFPPQLLAFVDGGLVRVFLASLRVFTVEALLV